MTEIATTATTSTVAAWVRAYRVAWGSNTDDDIRALFTDQAEYLDSPSSVPITGVDSIVAHWISQAEKPDDTVFSWEVVAVAGDLGFVKAQVDYVDGRLYDNLWVIHLADDGRARSFTEWYMRRPGSK